MKLKTGHLEDMIMVADKINEVIEDYNKRVGSDGIWILQNILKEHQ